MTLFPYFWPMEDFSQKFVSQTFDLFKKCVLQKKCVSDAVRGAKSKDLLTRQIRVEKVTLLTLVIKEIFKNLEFEYFT